MLASRRPGWQSLRTSADGPAQPATASSPELAIRPRDGSRGAGCEERPERLSRDSSASPEPVERAGQESEDCPQHADDDAPLDEAEHSVDSPARRASIISFIG
jgi:hypothetical protein